MHFWMIVETIRTIIFPWGCLRILKHPRYLFAWVFKIQLRSLHRSRLSTDATSYMVDEGRGSDNNIYNSLFVVYGAVFLIYSDFFRWALDIWRHIFGHWGGRHLRYTGMKLYRPTWAHFGVIFFVWVSVWYPAPSKVVGTGCRGKDQQAMRWLGKGNSL